MKTKLYRRVGGKHVKFNISKSGVSTSIKLGPITINPQRNRYSIDTPINGLSLRGKLVDNEAEPTNNDKFVTFDSIKRGDDIAAKVVVGIIITAIFVFEFIFN